MIIVDYMKKWKSRLIVSKGSENYSLKIDDIAFIYRNKLVIMAVDRDGNKYLLDKALSELEEELDPNLFFRLNRKIIVNINFIRSYKAIDRVKLEVNLTLSGQPFPIIVSQETAPIFKKWLNDDET
jgi:DNA-binding LytR/AlgR family response regulator